MKQLLILTCLFFIFTACEKSTDLTANSNSASSNENTEAVAKGTLVFTFNNAAQGWQAEGGATYSFVPSAGDPGGCVGGRDNDATQYWYFTAPASLLTAIRSQPPTGGNFKLSFALKAPSSNNTKAPDVIIVSPNATLVVDIADDPNSTSYSDFSVPFIKASGWKFDKLDGTPATTAQIKKALHTITKLLIRGEFDDATGNAGFLDNVSFAHL